MRALCKFSLLIVWALWFGGLMGLFLSVQVLFHQTERDIFLAAAPRLFIAFERYQLLLAASSLLLTFACRLLLKKGRWTAVFVLFAMATIGAVVETTAITPRIEALRIQGPTHSPQFLRLHGLSMCVYLAVAITLFVAGILQAQARNSE